MLPTAFILLASAASLATAAPAPVQPLGLRLVLAAKAANGATTAKLTIEISGNRLYEHYDGAPLLLVTRDGYIGCVLDYRRSPAVPIYCVKTPAEILKKYHGVYGDILGFSDPFSPGAPRPMAKVTKVFKRSIGGEPSVCHSGPALRSHATVTICASATGQFLTFEKEPSPLRLGAETVATFELVSAKRGVPVGPFRLPPRTPVK